MSIKSISVVLFDEFETLDAMGPVEVFGYMPSCQINIISRHGGEVTSSQGVTINTKSCQNAQFDTILIPGGMGTRTLSHDRDYLAWLRSVVEQSQLCLTVCTGSALLAQTSLIDDLRATTNKHAFKWVTSLNQKVNWQSKARWIHDDKFYTSSGVSAGIDMSLQVVADHYSHTKALEIAKLIEYTWSEDSENDPFSLSETRWHNHS